MLQRFLDWLAEPGQNALDKGVKLFATLLMIALFCVGFGWGSALLLFVYAFLIVHWYILPLFVLGSVAYARLELAIARRQNKGDTR